MAWTVLCLRLVSGGAACPCSSALESAPKAEQRRSPHAIRTMVVGHGLAVCLACRCQHGGGAKPLCWHLEAQPGKEPARRRHHEVWSGDRRRDRVGRRG